jgi:ABC-2 type transport system permease protein
MVLILTGVSFALGWVPDPMGLLAGLLGFGIITALGLALALIFSVANVFFRDFGKVTQTLTQFVTFSVPMIYPFSLVEERFGRFADLYLLNPLAEAVLLMQRCFWVGTTSDPEATIAEHLPPDLWGRGVIMFGLSLVLLVFAQLWFTKFERRVPERL